MRHFGTAWKPCVLPFLAALLLGGATFGVYAEALGHDFLHFDDNRYVTDNARVKAGLTPESIRWAFTTTEMVNWHPLTWLSFMADHQLFGLDASAFHRTNVVLHALNSALLFLALRSLTGQAVPSWFVAGFFALHPLHVESVAWVAERKDVLSTFFGVLALWAYARYARGRRVGWYVVVVLMLVLSLMAKPALVTFPFVLLLLDWWPLRRWPWVHPTEAQDDSPVPAVPWWKLLLEKVPLLIPVAASCAMTLHAQRHGNVSNEQATLPLRLEAATLSYVGYLRDTFWPTKLVPFRPYPRELFPVDQVVSAAGILVTITGIVLWLWRRQPWLVVGWLWFLGTMLPISGVVQIVGGHCQADRYTYVPLIGIFIMFAWGVPHLCARKGVPGWLPGLAGFVLLVVCSDLARNQVRHWRDTATLWNYTLSVDPSNEVAHAGLGVLAHQRGDPARAQAHYRAALRTNPRYELAHYNLALILWHQGHIDEAADHWRTAVEIYPRYAAAHQWLGAYHWRKGNLKEAIRAYEQGVAFAPEHAPGYDTLGTALVQGRRPAEAIDRFEQALAIDPRYEEAHFHLAQTLLAQGRAREAEERYRAALELNPQRVDSHTGLAWACLCLGKSDEASRAAEAALALNPGSAEAHYMLGVIQALQQQHEEASGHFRRAEQFQPRVGRYSYALGLAVHDCGQSQAASSWFRWGVWLDPGWLTQGNELAWGLATHPDADRRNGKLAVWLARQLCEATGNKDPHYLDTLAAAQAEDGKFDEAVATARRAITLHERARNLLQVVAARMRLESFSQKKAYRTSPETKNR